MIMHHHTKFGHKRFSGSKEIVRGEKIFDILNLRCDPDFEHSNPIDSQDTPPHNNMPPY